MKTFTGVIGGPGLYKIPFRECPLSVVCTDAVQQKLNDQWTSRTAIRNASDHRPDYCSTMPVIAIGAVFCVPATDIEKHHH